MCVKVYFDNIHSFNKSLFYHFKIMVLLAILFLDLIIICKYYKLWIMFHSESFFEWNNLLLLLNFK